MILPPETGASMYEQFILAANLNISFETDGSIVLLSMKMLPFCAPLGIERIEMIDLY